MGGEEEGGNILIEGSCKDNFSDTESEDFSLGVAGTTLRTVWRGDEEEGVRDIRGFETALLTFPVLGDLEDSFFASGVDNFLAGLAKPEALGSLVSANFS